MRITGYQKINDFDGSEVFIVETDSGTKTVTYAQLVSLIQEMAPAGTVTESPELAETVSALSNDLSQVKNRVTALESGTGTGSGGGSGITKITYDQYQALTSTQKQNGVYYITDYPNASSGVIIVDGEA